MTNEELIADIKSIDAKIADLKAPAKILTKDLAPSAAYMKYLAKLRVLSSKRMVAILRAAEAGALKFKWDVK